MSALLVFSLFSGNGSESGLSIRKDVLSGRFEDFTATESSDSGSHQRAPHEKNSDGEDSVNDVQEATLKNIPEYLKRRYHADERESERPHAEHLRGMVVHFERPRNSCHQKEEPRTTQQHCGSEDADVVEYFPGKRSECSYLGEYLSRFLSQFEQGKGRKARRTRCYKRPVRLMSLHETCRDYPQAENCEVHEGDKCT